MVFILKNVDTIMNTPIREVRTSFFGVFSLHALRKSNDVIFFHSAFSCIFFCVLQATNDA